MNCKRCTENTIKRGIVKGRQRYSCKSCNYLFMAENIKSKPKELKALAQMLYLNKLSFRQIGKICNISSTTAYRWVKQLDAQIEFTLKHENKPKQIEIDEMWHYVNAKKTNYGYGELSKEAVAELLQQLPANEIKRLLQNSGV